MENEKKIYCGAGKKTANPKYIQISVCLDNIPTEHINNFKDKRYVNLTLIEMDKPDEKGRTHSLVVNTYKKA